MRVVYVTHCARLAGAELALLRLLPVLEHVRAHVIAGEDGPLVSRLEAAGVGVEVLELMTSARDFPRARVRPSIQTATAAARSVVYTGRLAARLRALQPDLIHCNTLKAAFYGGLAARLANVPIVWHAREPVAANGFPLLARGLISKLASRIPDAVVADTQSVLSDFPGGRAERFVIPSPVAVRQLQAVPERDGHATDLVVTMIGRISPVKGQDVFLRAFAQADGDSRARAVIVGEPLFGEDQYERGLHSLADQLGIADRVTFRGFREDVAAELQSADIVVAASVIPEAFAQSVVEGMAAGRAVVAPAVGGPADVVEDGVTGLLFEPGNVDDLATTLTRLAGDRDLRIRLGRTARARASRYAPDVVGPQVEEMYRKVLRNREARRSG